MAIMLDFASNSPRGNFVEVGVYKGGSAIHLYSLAEKQKRDLFLFDTFNGTPFSATGLDAIPKGEFSDTSLESIQALMPNSVAIKGVFPKTLKECKLSNVAFAHIDCDQYWSVKESINALIPLMVEKGIMYIDDYGSLEGATKAVNECSHPIVLDNGKAIILCGE